MDEIEDENLEEKTEKPKRGKTPEQMSSLISQSKLSHIRRRELVKRIETLLLNGEKRSYIHVKIEEEFGITDRMYINNYITEARRNIIRTTSTSLEEIRALHVVHYERIYKYFDETSYPFGKAKSLQYKERLLGHHREDTFIEVNNETNIEIEISDEDLYNTSVLSSKEQSRLSHLKDKIEGKIEKAKLKEKKKRMKKLAHENRFGIKGRLMRERKKNERTD